MHPSFKVTRGYLNLKVLISRLLLALEVCNVKPTYRKSWARNLLMWSDLTLGPCFKVKQGLQNPKVLLNHLLLVLELCNVKSTLENDVVRFDLASLLKGQTRIAKLKVFITRLFLVLQVCNVKPSYRKSWARNLLM